MKKAINIITITLIILSGLSFSFIGLRVINITKNWTSKTCPAHNEKLVKEKVDCVVGGFAGIKPPDSRDYNNPPYNEGESPNAKYKYYSNPGCIKMYDKAIILYCKKCELIKNR